MRVYVLGVLTAVRGVHPHTNIATTPARAPNMRFESRATGIAALPWVAAAVGAAEGVVGGALVTRGVVVTGGRVIEEELRLALLLLELDEGETESENEGNGKTLVSDTLGSGMEKVSVLCA
jgi:hypothetical protein